MGANMAKGIMNTGLKLWLGLSLIIACQFVHASTLQVVDLQSRLLVGDRAQIMLKFDAPPHVPEAFILQRPAKLIFDFHHVQNALPAEKALQQLNLGAITGIQVVGTAEQTRMIVDLTKSVPYNVEINHHNLVITLESSLGSSKSSTDQEQSHVPGSAASKNLHPAYQTIKSLDFRRGNEGEGLLILNMGKQDVPVDFREESGKILIEFKGAKVSQELQRLYDVKDFGTPIQTVKVEQQKNNVLVEIEVLGDYDKVAYQIDNEYILEAKPLTALEKATLAKETFKFTGEPISLNFQDIDVRAVLQLLADFTGLNIVASDAVEGSVTLKLNNVPWDQALDYILKAKGLGKLEQDNIIMVAPNADIASKEQEELDAMQRISDAAPLRSQFIQVNYAKAEDMATILKDEANSLISDRGAVNFDVRTNTLLVKETEERIIEIKKLLEVLDKPVRQVLIETQIVEVSNSFTDAFGIRLGGAGKATVGRHKLGFGAGGADSVTNNSSGVAAINAASQIAQSGSTAGQNGLFFDFLSAASGGANLGFSIARLPGGTLLDLELRASETENKSRTIARPKLLTMDQQTATIESGKEVPFQTSSANNGTTTEFKKAVIKLEVTPHITPDDRINLDLTINKDSVDSETTGNAAVPAIDTTNITTSVLVDNGETIVLGGVFDTSSTKNVNRVPYFSRIPFLGRMFRSDAHSVKRDETLIFVTPKIMANFLRKAG